MSQAVAVWSRAQLLDALHGIVDGLLDLDTYRDTDAELLAQVDDLQRLRNRLPAVEHAVIGAVDTRGVARQVGAVSTQRLLIGRLHLDPGEARARVDAARQLTARVSPSGAVGDPEFPKLAAAQADGSVSEPAARLITRAVGTTLPVAARPVFGALIEQTLVAQAAHTAPRPLYRQARRLIDAADPTVTNRDTANAPAGCGYTNAGTGPAASTVT